MFKRLHCGAKIVYVTWLKGAEAPLASPGCDTARSYMLNVIFDVLAPATAKHTSGMSLKITETIHCGLIEWANKHHSKL